MTTHESHARRQIAELGASFFTRGLTFGRTGNISVRVGERVLVTPTGSSLGALDPDALSVIDTAGTHVDGPAPSKEAFLHAVMYRARREAGAVVHLHSTHAVAVSCLADIDPRDALPPLTAYYAMRIGRLPLLPYHAPGDSALESLAESTAAQHHAMLLANHGPIVAATDLAGAADAVEELEETARLFLLLRGERTRPLTRARAAELRLRFAPDPLSYPTSPGSPPIHPPWRHCDGP
ncbi:3-oxo-tetronate 4-phosphate decarboxylase [Streptomyces sp. NPDC005263]|uniref:3-oxo-tetronate 4-phosphate decarboxylase n=1 Tax=Streptomyces sp. NPDC005263 TaxID=3364711 RepID=UPI003695B49C